MLGVRVALSSGDVFWVDATLDEMISLLHRSASAHAPVVMVGGRAVNYRQVAMLTYEQIPSIEVYERLKEVVTDGAHSE